MELIQANHFKEECDVLNDVLKSMNEEDWCSPTQFKGWTANDIVRHLHMFDVAADLTLDSRDSLKEFLNTILSARSAGQSLVEYTGDWVDGCQGEELRDRWYQSACKLAQRYLNEDPSKRVAWGGPDMSVRSCISARQMETWSHGQAIFDLQGMVRSEGERLYNVVMIGINTFAWSFLNRQLAVPELMPQVKLVAPNGEPWTFDRGESPCSISGSAVEFCQVVTQTRNVLDTELMCVGEVAEKWMSIAQCFAGPAHNPPKPGERFRVTER